MSASVQSKTNTSRAARQRIELILGQLDKLPTLPAVATRLLAVTTCPDSHVSDVVKVIESDAALTAELLRKIRSADLGVRGEVLTVQRAVVLLGFHRVRSLALSVHLFDAFAMHEQNERTRQMRSGVWLHSLAVALTAEMLAERLHKIVPPGEAFVCGLLHDIGKIALDACMPKGYARVLEEVERHQSCICDVERSLFGLDHTSAGKRLAMRWRLPPAVVECIWLHHQDFDALPSSIHNGTLVRIIHLSDQLVRQAGIGYSGYQFVGDVDELCTRLRLEPHAVHEDLMSLPEKLAPLQAFLGLDTELTPEKISESLTDANRALVKDNIDLLDDNQDLKIRSSCIAAVDSFTQLIDGHDSLADICEAAASSLRIWLECPQALVVYVDRTHQGLYFGYSPFHGKTSGSKVMGLQEDSSAEEDLQLNQLPPIGSMTPATEEHDHLWRRVLGKIPAHSLWILPIVDDEQACSAILISANEDRVRPYLHNSTCETIARMIAMAMNSSRIRREASWMTDELLDLNRQLNTAQRQLIRTRMISMIAAMAAGAAHELHNPLSVISGRAQMERDRSEDEQTQTALQVIVDQVDRASRIVTDLMRYAKPDEPAAIEQRLEPLLEGLCQHWQEQWKLAPGIISSSSVDPDVVVYVDPDQLRIILDALVANAVEACDPESIHVEINSPSRATDETVRIVVSDNGVGMIAEVLEHAFDPFFSSRPAGRGRGLGLSRANRLAEINGGKIRLHSAPGAGSKVTLELPSQPTES